MYSVNYKMMSIPLPPFMLYQKEYRKQFSGKLSKLNEEKTGEKGKKKKITSLKKVWHNCLTSIFKTCLAIFLGQGSQVMKGSRNNFLNYCWKIQKPI